MKVVAFDGSKEPRGPVGRRVARVVERLRDQGVEAELVRLERVRHTGCTMCAQCGHRTGELTCAGPPVDGLRRVVRLLKAADAIVVATPAYGGTGSPTTQEVLLRLEHDRRERGDTRLAGKPALVIVGPPDSGVEAAVARLRRRLEAHAVTVVDVLGAGAPGEDVDPALDGAVAALLAARRERRAESLARPLA